VVVPDQDEPDDEIWGNDDDECQSCESYSPLNDLGLCTDCAAKLERDLIRQCDWNYSVTAFLVPDEAREDLRRQVIQQFGEKLELIAPEERTPPRRSAHWRKGRRAHERHAATEE
jgi:hypothetical protein